jgi:addiction module HigA family antidote
MRARKREPAHPGRIIKGLYLEEFSITISDLAKVLGVSRKTVSKIVNERGAISSGMALRLSRAFNTSPELWLNLQRNYDLWHACRDSNDWKNVRPVVIQADVSA